MGSSWSADCISRASASSLSVAYGHTLTDLEMFDKSKCGVTLVDCQGECVTETGLPRAALLDLRLSGSRKVRE